MMEMVINTFITICATIVLINALSNLIDKMPK